MTLLDLSAEQMLSTTRAVRKRLDFERPVDLALIRECLELAVQAPTASSGQHWQFVVVQDEGQRRELAAVYRKGFAQYRDVPGSVFDREEKAPPEMRGQFGRVASSAEYLVEHMHRVPVMVVPCVEPKYDVLPGQAGVAARASAYASIYPAVWSFMLAARLRGLGTVLTTAHLFCEQEAAEVLGIPFERVCQSGLIPVAHTLGTDFAPTKRKPLEQVVHLDDWGCHSDLR